MSDVNLFLNSNLQEIDRLKTNLKNWDDALLERIKVDFTFYSNKIEGNALTYGETISIIKDGIKPKNRSIRDVFSIENHKRFVDKLFESYDTDLSVSHIKGLHKSYMDSVLQWAEGTGENYSPGVLKWDANGTVRPNGEYKIYMEVELILAALEELCAFVNLSLNDGKRHPVLIASYFHQRFIGEIHPFVDGNGRLGRMLTNQILMRGGVSPATFDLNDQSKFDYIKVMDAADTARPESMIESDLLFSKMVLKTQLMK